MQGVFISYGTPAESHLNRHSRSEAFQASLSMCGGGPIPCHFDGVDLFDPITNLIGGPTLPFDYVDLLI